MDGPQYPHPRRGTLLSVPMQWQVPLPPHPYPADPPKCNDEPTSKFKGEAGWGARGMLESSRELSLVDCSWGASIPCPGLSYPFLCVEYSSLKTTRFSHHLLKLPPRGRVLVATGGTWLWYPSCRLCIPWGPRAFGSIV